MNTLKLRLDNLPEPPPPVNLRDIETSITKLDNQLDALAQKFLARSEPEAIQRLAQIVNQLQEQFNNLPFTPEQVYFNDLKKVIASMQERLVLLESLNSSALSDQLTQLQADLKSTFKHFGL
ncbi:hypothetical protein BZZ01_10005 [Nostocales cyanobacterium HT-58-2]|nr:hypothetical protein BZZ01_10005 [Nostocales cyanobacterium HT-58-2]